MSKSVLVHIVTFNSEQYILPCIAALLNQNGFINRENLIIEVSDNASSDGSKDLLSDSGLRQQANVFLNEVNLGFCAAHNAGAARFLESGCDYLLILNPDVRLTENALSNMIAEIENFPEAGTACARLYRSDADLNPLQPFVIDSAGISVSSSLRHFDRGGGKADDSEYAQSCYVFGGTGACLLLKRDFIKSVEVREEAHSESLFEIYPQLQNGYENRCQLFDEGFFAYREDADLAWRAQIMGWKSLYAASAIGYHKRLVTPERRGELAPVINLYGVRNRFLLQLNNFHFDSLRCVVNGFLFRNLIVLLAVVFYERSSLTALKQIWQLRRRAIARRQIINNKKKKNRDKVARWFKSSPYVEPL